MRLLSSELAVRAIGAMRQSGGASLASLSYILEAPPSSVQRALQILVEDGLVEASGVGRSRLYTLTASPLVDPVERLARALLGPRAYLALLGRANPAVEFVGLTNDELVIVFRKRSDPLVQSLAATTADLVAGAIDRSVRLLDHQDLRRPSESQHRLRQELLAGDVLAGDLDVSVPDRTGHRRGAGKPLGRVNPAIHLPSARTLNAIKRHHGVLRMSAFGSAVRSDFRPDSDIDIAVRLAPDASKSLRALEALEADLEERIGRDVDLVLEQDLHPAFRATIRKEAVAI